MKYIWPLFLLCPLMALKGQYLFTGQVSDIFRNRPVYLSLVEDYRKSSRIYSDQIIQKTQADSLGFFSFTGDNLSEENRIYRIHTDNCSDVEANKNHFLRECSASESLLLIANNADTITMPLGNQNEAFCSIISTNTASDKLLDVALLKEAMIIDFSESQTEAAKSLNFTKWFKKLQDFAEAINEPLVDLYCYDFLSKRESETYSQYLKDLESNNYYDRLLSRLNTKYPNASFTKQFGLELKLDKIGIEEARGPFDAPKWFYILLVGIVVIGLIFFVYRIRESRKFKNEPVQRLTRQERKIYKAICEGKSNKEIASALYISLSTVKSHINSIYKKLGVSSREELQGL